MKSNRYFASAFFSGHFLTFDGASYDFNGLGEYVLFSSASSTNEDFKVHIRQRVGSSYGSGAEIDAVALSIGHTVVEIHIQKI